MATKKHFGYTASIQKDTNRLIASSQANWGSLEEGSFIIFEDDQDFYKVVGKENYFYIKDFDKVEEDKIFIHENVGIRLSINASIKLTFKENELSSIKIKNPGEGFKIEDVLTVKGGEIKKDLIEDASIPTQIKVTKVDEKGGLLEVEIISNSLYLSPPEETLQKFDSCELDLVFSLSDKRTIESRSISNLLYSEKGTVIVLNHPLPPNTKHGKISVDKWELILDTNYSKGNKANASYRVLTDFTPNLNLPLLRDDISKNEAILNKALMTMDKEIQDIKNKLT